MSATKSCPDCGDDINVLAKSHKCGWRQKTKEVDRDRDPQWRQCDDTVMGRRCANAGVVSASTLGGQFFCWQHAQGALRGSLPVPPTPTTPHSSTLTAEQWYAVCKFFPNVAKRCSRQFASVGPDNPLDATVKLGPLLTGLDEAARERAAIQDES